ncbi:hypothetical protein [Alishewanella longhuensis]
MKLFNKNKRYALIALAVSGLYGCGGAKDAEPNNIPVNIQSTSADIAGSAVKGTLSNALVSVSQLNGAAITMGGSDRTGNDGKIHFTVQAKQGFGINAMFKVEITADEQSSMVCDAIACAGVAMGGQLSGAPLTGSKFTTLTYVQVPYASSHNGVADASFHANALTTMAAGLVAKESLPDVTYRYGLYMNWLWPTIHKSCCGLWG